MASFRPIQPAGRRGDGANLPPPIPPPIPPPPAPAPFPPAPKRRHRSVVQACRVCRQLKAKCDGARPLCGNCVTRNKACGYDGEAGQPRQTALRTRLEALEELFSTLQAKPVDEAHRLLLKIRASDDIASLAKGRDVTSPATQDGGSQQGPPDITAATATATATTAASTTSQDLQSSQDPERTVSPPTGPVKPQNSQGLQKLDSLQSLQTPSPSSRSSQQLLGLPTTPAIRGDEVIQFNDGREQTSVLSRALVIRPQNSMKCPMPDPETTQKAIDGFFSSSGKLFHVFSPEQVQCYFDIVFHSKPGTDVRVAAACIGAVAAVGTQYLFGDFHDSVTEMLYDAAQHHFEIVLHEKPLEAIKLCTLLTMYNILNKATVALAYVEIGLSMAKRYSLDSSSPNPEVPDPMRTDYRRSWRTLMFFSSWLSFTLGYMSGNEFLFKRLQLSELNVSNSSEITDIVQTEMTKICVLKADILRMHLAFRELGTPAMDSIMEDLTAWYGQLPPQMLLGYPGHQELQVEVRRSIFHVHLLYLGAIMLLYRRIASQFIRSIHVHQSSRSVLWRPFESRLESHVQKGVEAAKESAGILDQLLDENGIFKRCWLVIFQAYTSCTVIAHCVAQKQLHKLSPAIWEDDLRQAKRCLRILNFCGSVDPVAMQFHETFTHIFQELRDYTPYSKTAMNLDNFGDFSSEKRRMAPPAEYLLTFPPDAAPELVERSLRLLDMLCRPFGGPNNKTYADEDVKELWRTNVMRFEHPQMVELLDWDFENKLPFQWDVKSLTGRPELEAGLADGNRFLGSKQPHYWSGSQEFMRGGS